MDVPDRLITGGNVLGKGATGTDGKRRNAAGYVELSLPAAKALEFQLAGRQDKYSDFGSAFSPKIGMKWTPDKAVSSCAQRCRVARTHPAGKLPFFGHLLHLGRRYTAHIAQLQPEREYRRLVRGQPDAEGRAFPATQRRLCVEPNRDFNIGVTWYKIRQNDVVASNGFKPSSAIRHCSPGQILRAADGTLLVTSTTPTAISRLPKPRGSTST